MGLQGHKLLELMLDSRVRVVFQEGVKLVHQHQPIRSTLLRWLREDAIKIIR